MCFAAAAHAYRRELSDVLGDGQKRRHGTEWLCLVVHVQACNNHPETPPGEDLYDADQFFSEELRLVNAYYLLIRYTLKYGMRARQRRAFQPSGIMTHHGILGVPVVYRRLENAHALPGNSRSLQPAYQFFRLTGKHTAAYNFNGAGARHCK